VQNVGAHFMYKHHIDPGVLSSMHNIGRNPVYGLPSGASPMRNNVGEYPAYGNNLPGASSSLNNVRGNPAYTNPPPMAAGTNRKEASTNRTMSGNKLDVQPPERRKEGMGNRVIPGNHRKGASGNRVISVKETACFEM